MRLFMATVLAAGVSPDPSASVPRTHAQIDVPRARAQQVIVQSREFPVGGESGWHVHPGTEITYVTAGQVELRVKGKTTYLNPGDSFTVPRGVAHNGANHASQAAHVVITLVVDKGVPARQAVAAP